MITLRPLGPSVIFTALERISTPRSMRSRTSVEKRTSLAAIESLWILSGGFLVAHFKPIAELAGDHTNNLFPRCPIWQHLIRWRSGGLMPLARRFRAWRPVEVISQQL